MSFVPSVIEDPFPLWEETWPNGPKLIVAKTNGLVIQEAAKLWISPEDQVMDVTYGNGLWWTLYRPEGLITHDLAIDKVDFRHLPHEDRSIDVVAYDPPYISPGGRKTSTISDFNEAYGLVEVPSSPKALTAMINDGLREIERVLRGQGRILVKCMDYVSSGKMQVTSHDICRFATKKLGLEVADYFIHVSGAGPQPKKNLDGSERRQVHSRRVHSYLYVLKKGGRRGRKSDN